MRRIILLILIGGVFIGGATYLAAEPPPDFICFNPGPRVPKDHECQCHHSCQKQPPTLTTCDYEGDDQENCHEVPNPHAGEMQVMENAKCKVYCRPKNCGCKVEGCETT